MSGSPLCIVWGLQSRHEGEKKAFELASKLGITTKNKDKVLESLYKLPAADILEKAHEMKLLPFRPVIESWLAAIGQEKFLSKCPVDKYNSGKYNKGPHMMGFVNVEAKAISETNASIPFVSPILQKLIYAGSFSALPKVIAKQLIQTVTDLAFITGIDTKQQLLRTHNRHPIYYYRFSQDSSEYPGFIADKNHLNITGAGHADDLAYLFYFSEVGLPSDPAIEKTSRRLVRFVTNFVKYGNPTPNGTADPLLGITWPNSGLLGRSMDINTELSTGLRPINAEVMAFEALGLGRSRFLGSCFD
ncbi:uncharacterized protein LOC107980480 isoform X1 [Nasonia vitripennis]|uniref:Carboxylesterase type B domain-containing protein n=1 Tax=Nasonia vitripennis TaxID=7425 RepID=A0A7M7Q1F3_NASVI|nr:uncharacterized protein LOC107980480 isoform X1 [Nasonia vitripennis]